MSWSLSASGHCDTPEAETKLAAAVGHALAGAGTQVTGAQFYGHAFSGDPRSLTPTPERTPAGDSQAAPAAADSAE